MEEYVDKTDEAMTAQLEAVRTQAMLIADMLVHLQNAALREVFDGKRRTPLRVPPSNNAETIVSGPDEGLRIVKYGAVAPMPPLVR